MSLDIDLKDETGDVIVSHNITHNLAVMARHCGLNDALWGANEHTVPKTKDMIKSLYKGLGELIHNKETLLEYNPKNGWGSYDSLLGFTADVLVNCVKYPDSEKTLTT